MTRARDHLYLVGTVATGEDTMASIKTGDADDPSNWYDFLGPVVFNDEGPEALANTGEYAWQGTSENPLTIRLPRSAQQLTSRSSRDAPSLSIDVPELTPDPEYSIPASYLGSLIHDGAPGEITVDHSGRHVSYAPPTDAEENDSDDEASPEYLPRAVFGTALHKAAELSVDTTDTAKLRRLVEQCAVQADVSPGRIDDDDIVELQRHLQTQSITLGLSESVCSEEVWNPGGAPPWGAPPLELVVHGVL